MRFNQFYVLGLSALIAVVVASSSVAADDEDATVRDSPLKVEGVLAVVAEPESKHWVGVYAVPVEAALKSHLGIKEDRVIVKQVMDGGPAKKAGVQTHDVLVQYGDVSISTVADLIKAVEKLDGKEGTLTFIRGGKESSLKLTAEERPEGDRAFNLAPVVAADARRVIVEWLQKNEISGEGGNPYRIQIVGPGVVDRRNINVEELRHELAGVGAKLPKNLSIQINKSGGAPAKIKVTRDGETWDVTEENLDELPEEIRAHVKRSLGGHPRLAIGYAPSGQKIRLKALQVRPATPVTPYVAPQVIRKAAPATSYRIQRTPIESNNQLDQIRQDLKALKAEIEKLRAAQEKQSDN